MYPRDQYTAEKAAKEIVDNKLKNTDDTFYFVCFESGAKFKMIVQKYMNAKYASFILFGYGLPNIVYKTKVDGIWL